MHDTTQEPPPPDPVASAEPAPPAPATDAPTETRGEAQPPATSGAVPSDASAAGPDATAAEVGNPPLAAREQAETREPRSPRAPREPREPRDPAAEKPHAPGAISDLAACAAELKARFPALFTGAPKPLKLRVQADIQQRAPGVFTRQALTAFLRRHTGSNAYLIALTQSSERFDLDGQGAGDLNAEHRDAAAQELARRRELRQQREQAAGREPPPRRDPREDEARRERAVLLRDFERTTLTEANFCALKGIPREQLQAQLAQAREEAAAWARRAPPPLPHGHGGPHHQGPHEPGDRRPWGGGERAPRPPHDRPAGDRVGNERAAHRPPRDAAPGGPRELRPHGAAAHPPHTREPRVHEPPTREQRAHDPHAREPRSPRPPGERPAREDRGPRAAPGEAPRGPGRPAGPRPERAAEGHARPPRPEAPRRDRAPRDTAPPAAEKPPAEPGVVIGADALRRLAALLVTASGGSEREASMVAANLVETNLTGHDSHGVGMLPAYVDNALAGGLKVGAQLTIVNDAGALVTVNGNAGYGQVMAHDTMVLAIERARQHGVAVVGLANSHHIGRIGAWAEQCIAAGLVSVHFVNVLSRPVVAPFNGSDGRFVTNPFCVGIPVAGEAPVVLDFATSRIAVGKVRVAMLKGEKVRPGTLLDAEGHPSTDPGVLFAEPHGALLPFGEHKGYGLAVVCEILGGALAGGLTLHEPPSPHAIINNMLSFVVDPERLGTAKRLAEEARAFAAWVQASPPRPGREVMLPGEPERRHRADRSVNGIPIDANSWRALLDAGRRAGLTDEAMFAAAGVAGPTVAREPASAPSPAASAPPEATSPPPDASSPPTESPPVPPETE